jgi:hypothetical protein
MAVPRADAKMWERVKKLEEDLGRLRADLVGGGVDPDDQIHDPLGNLLVGADLDAGQGLKKPRLSFTITSPAAATVITSATYVEAFSIAGRRQNAACEVRFSASCDAGTTGSVRAVIAGTVTELHAPVPIADGDTITPAWSLNLPGIWDDYVIVEIQALRATGSGNVRVRPYSAAGG